MTDEPRTWHYGLVARWWAEFNHARPEELAFYRAAIERFGQPALDLGCGTGRIMLPLVAEGLDVDGIDVSEDMLSHARRRAVDQGLAPTLRAQAFHEPGFPRADTVSRMTGRTRANGTSSPMGPILSSATGWRSWTGSSSA